MKIIVTPILEYLIISNFGHFLIRSTLTPALKRKKRLIKLISSDDFKFSVLKIVSRKIVIFGVMTFLFAENQSQNL